MNTLQGADDKNSGKSKPSELLQKLFSFIGISSNDDDKNKNTNNNSNTTSGSKSEASNSSNKSQIKNGASNNNNNNNEEGDEHESKLSKAIDGFKKKFFQSKNSETETHQ